MVRKKYLEEQVERAERLATLALDTLTVQRLVAFAADCRRELIAVQGAKVA